jgi:hypothetical protein
MERGREICPSGYAKADSKYQGYAGAKAYPSLNAQSLGWLEVHQPPCS